MRKTFKKDGNSKVKQNAHRRRNKTASNAVNYMLLGFKILSENLKK